MELSEDEILPVSCTCAPIHVNERVETSTMGHKTAFRRVFPHVSASFSTFPTVVGNFEAAW